MKKCEAQYDFLELDEVLTEALSTSWKALNCRRKPTR